MSNVIFTYPHLENAQKIFEAIQRDYDKFDWSWLGWDWEKNCKATQLVMTDPDVRDQFEANIRLFKITWENWESSYSFFYREDRMKTFIDLYPDGCENYFDFSFPLDVINLFDDVVWRAEEMKSFYQIKIA